MNKQGQSIVEYSLIAILVVLGIVFMGPYVLRSIDAHFKLWDEGTQDTFEENLKQAPLNVIPTMSSNCECTQTTGNCGGPGSGSLCAVNQKEVDWVCTPYQGCNGASGNATCETSPQCCGCPVASGCGSQDTTTETTTYPPSSMPCPYVTTQGQQCNSSSNIPSSSACFCPVGSTYDSSTGGCTTPPIITSSPCYYGYRIYNYQCGSSTPTVCVKDTYDPNTPKDSDPNGCPLPTCTGSIPYPDSTIYCATGTSTPSSADLTTNTPNAYVDKSSCNSSIPCEVYCVPPYAPNVPPGTPVSQATECTLSFIVAGNSCTVDTNFATSNCPTCNIDNPNNGSASCTCDNCHNASPDCGSSGHCVISVNNQSFTTCSSGLPIASATASPGFPQVASTRGITLTDGNVCGSPEGMPGDGCNINVSWGNN